MRANEPSYIRKSIYRSLAKERGEVCAICGREPPVRHKLDIDHDHSCHPKGKICAECVRGLLCFSCNTKLGWYEKWRDEIHRYLSAERLDFVALAEGDYEAMMLKATAGPGKSGST